MLDFYFTVSKYGMTPEFPNYPVLFSAGSWWSGSKITLPRWIDRVDDIICDCGSYSVFSRFGGFPFSWEDYMRWVALINPKWFAIFDVIGDPLATQKYVDKYADSGGIPTCQGNSPIEYRHHARDLKGFDLIGVGNLVKSKYDIHHILDGIFTELPDVKVHLWGYGLGRLKKAGYLIDNVVSTDSSNWMGRFGRGIEEYKENKDTHTQKEYAVQVMLPRYHEKVKNWQNKPKQKFIHGF